MMPNCYVSRVEKTDPQYHRSTYIIHIGQWYFAEFETGKQFDFFCETVGLHLGEQIECKPFMGDEENEYRSFRLNCDISRNEKYFYTRAEVPAEAKPIKALSNGSIVTCYYYNDGETLHFYRPNSNAPRAIYDPLTIDQHINHVKIYGLY